VSSELLFGHMFTVVDWMEHIQQTNKQTETHTHTH